MRETKERESNNWRKENKNASKVGEVNYVVQYLNWRIKRGNVHSEREKEKKNEWSELICFIKIRLCKVQIKLTQTHTQLRKGEARIEEIKKYTKQLRMWAMGRTKKERGEKKSEND